MSAELQDREPISIEIRPYAAFDLPGMYRVCLQTGASGQDATALYRDPDLLAHIYAGPYPVADPGLSFVAADEQGVLGYVVATADSHGFDAWLEKTWLPPLRHRYPRSLAADPGDGTLDWQRVEQIHTPRPSGPDALYDRWPAHLHIDILPRGQGTGLGRRLIDVLLDALRERGVRGLHLSVGASNPGARAFYLKLGFTEAERHGWGSVMVIDPTDVRG
ncbi:GNAT family N-acetyltransferase [Streptomyces beijiangensis]|uniref:GNAT family N-acetyltransferase n=1 Tax=Streptomyces beijiangensis TaxID=163361 RepID=A0A939F800_9ACTN|nr:GNAT family N-acetyltransferase [Streptomyces beijiangensis]MBO0514030.1 GNAT family N-acetyltransferase [Streptomyces beijiangensis]